MLSNTRIFKRENLSLENMKTEIKKFYSLNNNIILDKINNSDIIFELDYIRVMYKKPLSLEAKIRLRKKIINMINISDEYNELYEYILHYYDCL